MAYICFGPDSARAACQVRVKICSEKGPKHIYTHAARKNLPRLVALRNLFAIIVFSFPTAFPYFGKIPESDQAR